LELLKKLKAQALQEKLTGKKRKENKLNESVPEISDIVDPSDIQGYRKKQRMSKEERVQTVMVSSKKNISVVEFCKGWKRRKRIVWF
jgi:hypothetical protein